MIPALLFFVGGSSLLGVSFSVVTNQARGWLVTLGAVLILSGVMSLCDYTVKEITKAIRGKEKQ